MPEIASQRHCRNCGALIRGEYCADCGQREGIADQRFLEVARDLAGDVIEFDSRLWRTLYPLMLRPGLLSAEYFAGRRARYLPPLRLYLVLSFCLFLYFSFVTASGSAPEVLVVEADGVETVERAEGESVNGEVREAGPADDPNDGSFDFGISNESSPAWLKDVEQRLETNAGRLRDDPSPLVGAMLDYAPQIMFLLLPLFALLVQIAYLFSPYHYLQHLVFALHYHSFAFFLYLLDVALEALWSGFGTLLMLWMLVYLPAALHRAYGSSWPGALGKTLFICIGYGALALAASIAALVWAILTL